MGELIDRPAIFAGERRGQDMRQPPEWPGLGELRMADEEASQRLAGIGGSDANIILSGDRDRILALWREKRGEAGSARPEHQPGGHAGMLDRGVQPPMV